MQPYLTYMYFLQNTNLHLCFPYDLRFELKYPFPVIKICFSCLCFFTGTDVSLLQQMQRYWSHCTSSCWEWNSHCWGDLFVHVIDTVHLGYTVKENLGILIFDFGAFLETYFIKSLPRNHTMLDAASPV